MITIDKILSLLDDVLLFLAKKKRNALDNDDIWHIRLNWQTYKVQLRKELLSGQFVFSSCKVVEYKPGKYLHAFRTQDMLVLKALAMALNQVLPKSLLCYSWKGHGGVTKALKDIRNTSVNYFVKTDVSDYYASLCHFQILQKLEPFVGCIQSRRLLYLALKCREGGVGIPRGSPLSHVLGNFYLHDLDVTFEGRETQHYFRYMDDILLLSDKKGALRRGIKTVRQTFNVGRLDWAHHKSFIGTIGRHQTVFLGQRLFERGLNGDENLKGGK
ncbi:RNA-directed DNA polymerase [Vibrio owensii]|uniref:RNA-directed DNA polymerase n=1 Tax=Vibrio owensii TaxID=696485 RepID=UPI003AADFF19